MCSEFMTFGRAFVPAVISLVALAGVASAEPSASDVRRATEFAQAGHCEEALGLLGPAHRIPTADGDAVSILAQCMIAEGRYQRAVVILEELRVRQPHRPAVPLYLAIARFHAGDLKGARSALKAAEKTVSDRAETHLYRGILELEAGRPATAVRSLARAREIDASAVEPVASYYEALAWRANDRRDQMARSLDTVRASGPESPWAQAAEEWSQPQLDARLPRRKSLSMSFGVEHDDNVVLRGVDPPLAGDVSDESDDRVSLSLSGGIDLFRSHTWSAGVFAGYSASRHDDLEGFDVHAPRAGIWVRRVIDERSSARLQLDGAHSFADGRSVRTAIGLAPSYLRVWENAGATHWFARANYHDFHHFNGSDVPDGLGSSLSVCPSVSHLLCGPAGVDERSDRDPDGLGGVAGFEHRYFLAPLRTRIAGGYAAHYFHARGRENRYQGHEAKLSFQSFLPWGFRSKLSLGYMLRLYRTPSSLPDPEALFVNRQYDTHDSARQDDVFTAQVELARPVGRWGELAARWSWTKQDSNVALFNYDRSVVGLYLKTGLAR